MAANGVRRQALVREITGIDQAAPSIEPLWAPTERMTELRSKGEV